MLSGSRKTSARCFDCGCCSSCMRSAKLSSSTSLLRYCTFDLCRAGCNASAGRAGDLLCAEDDGKLQECVERKCASAFCCCRAYAFDRLLDRVAVRTDL